MAARGASAPTEGGEGREHIVAAARLHLVVCLSCPAALHDIIYHTLMARYGLFVLKVQLNTNQPTNQPIFETVSATTNASEVTTVWRYRNSILLLLIIIIITYPPPYGRGIMSYVCLTSVCLSRTSGLT